MKDLTLCIIQSDIVWEQAQSNLDLLSEKLKSLNNPGHITILPEMFSTGFSMKPKNIAETMDGKTIQWMKNIAREKKTILCGSLPILDQGQYFNRLLWVMPNGQTAHYDKRHIFSYAGENEHYSAGNKRLITQVNGWKICVNICYDLRFPVWTRNVDDYDVLLYIANWPQQRNEMWEALLKARAIENQCYVIGVNRVGIDGNGHQYIGNSSIYDPLGCILCKAEAKETIIQQQLSYEQLNSIGQKFPFLQDRDRFILL